MNIAPRFVAHNNAMGPKVAYEKRLELGADPRPENPFSTAKPSHVCLGSPSHCSRSPSSSTEADEACSDLASECVSISEHSNCSSDMILGGGTLGTFNEDLPSSMHTYRHEPLYSGTFHDSGVQMGEDDQGFYESAKTTTLTPVHPTQPMTCLQDELFAALTPTHQETRGFFAKGQLSRILTEERVRRELAIHFGDSHGERAIAEYAKEICQETIIPTQSPRQSITNDQPPKTRSYIKILAILILIQKTKTIIKILEDPSAVNDSDLPLIRIPRPNHERLYDLRIHERESTVLECFQKHWWDQLNIRNFEEWQWTALPLVFGRATAHAQVPEYVLSQQMILPFTSGGQTALEGGFARVFKVAIHPEHHCFHTNSSRPNSGYFAVKSLHSQNMDSFQREVEILKKFSSNKHEHLISLLTTYEQDCRFFLVFDWAEADLQTYWKKVDDSPSFDEETVLWLARQCKGIAHGITKIHEHESIYKKPSQRSKGNQNVVFGHHGDIKPENVLWFADPRKGNRKATGTLKLSDFGLAEFSIHQTLSMTERSKWGVSLAYRAPETDLEPERAIGRSYDVWTLGCLYLEFITWMLGGRELLDEFLQKRLSSDAMWHYSKTATFFELELEKHKTKAVVKSTVKQFIRSLHERRNCSMFFHDFLDMVEDDLLVVKKNDRRRIDRKSIQQIYSAFVGMLEKCETQPDYAITPCPRLSSPEVLVTKV